MNLIEHTIIEKCNEIASYFKYEPKDVYTCQRIQILIGDILLPMYREGHLTDYSYSVRPVGDIIALDLSCVDLTDQPICVLLAI